MVNNYWHVGVFRLSKIIFVFVSHSIVVCILFYFDYLNIIVNIKCALVDKNLHLFDWNAYCTTKYVYIEASFLFKYYLIKTVKKQWNDPDLKSSV